MDRSSIRVRPRVDEADAVETGAVVEDRERIVHDRERTMRDRVR